MTDTYAAAKEQLDDIVTQVRKKDVSLERSLDLLEEGVALANRCTELIDQAAWEVSDEADTEADSQFDDVNNQVLDESQSQDAVEEGVDPPDGTIQNSETQNIEEIADDNEPASEH
ncbi:MAG: exodeoxyribonuclease VII small subunit [Coriobacteriia bacterium]|nr:exodeoxyribonuclease VII small subunit [Coriobacteriia bacterium]